MVNSLRLCCFYPSGKYPRRVLFCCLVTSRKNLTPPPLHRMERFYVCLSSAEGLSENVFATGGSLCEYFALVAGFCEAETGENGL